MAFEVASVGKRRGMLGDGAGASIITSDNGGPHALPGG